MKRRQLAFSLIELLIVISIIIMLISLLIPSMRNAKEVSKSLVCKSNQRQLFFAHKSYSQNWSGKFPHWNNWLWEGPKGGIPSAEWVEYGRIWPYVNNRDAYFCPSDNRKRYTGPSHLAIGSGGSKGEDPIHSYVRIIEPHRQMEGGSAKNLYLGPLDFFPGVFSAPGGSTIAGNYDESPKGPSDVAMMFEESSGVDTPNPPDGAWALLNDGFSYFIYIQDMMTGRHFEQGHVLMWDGHTQEVDAYRFNQWPVTHDPYAEGVVFGVPTDVP